MRLGYVQIKNKQKSASTEIGKLRRSHCESVHIDSCKASHMDWKKRPELRDLLDISKPGDTIVMLNLEQLSVKYQVWLEFLSELKKWELELEIVDSPLNKLEDWQYLFQWLLEKDHATQPGIKVKKFSQERTIEKKQYSCFSRDPYFRRVYWEILQQVIARRSLRYITKESGIPFATILRIRKTYTKVRRTVSVIGVFLMTWISLRLVQHYSVNVFLQMVIFGMMMLLLIYVSYSDNKSN